MVIRQVHVEKIWWLLGPLNNPVVEKEKESNLKSSFYFF